ncbi:MAG: hypothetical protein EZS28_031552 [Streblomastix strix]|uniref:Right handed beta helix domain-containing protein n=1 Tax=Streblomastix strix TaxID=222440 RepID=A0A5J4USL0_9EUKA|nr:MAG: hypothetical protein EZS28_031552 [Streblomastix strix]
MQSSHFTALLFFICIVNVSAEAIVGTLEGTLELEITGVKKKIAHLGEGRYITNGINVAYKHISLHGSKYTEIQAVDTVNLNAMFIGEEADIYLQNLRFKSIGNLVAIVERKSQLAFVDNILIGTTIRNCFEVDGGELILSNLKLEFEINDERRVSNLVNFGELGGNLHVQKTSIEQVIIDGDIQLFGDGIQSQISLTNCKFTQLHFDRISSSNFASNIIGQGNVIIQDCAFIDVENALEGGVVNGLNTNGSLQVVGSLFKSCYNTKHINEGISNKGYHTDISSGDARFSDVTFEGCSSQNFGGSISFISNGKLSLSDVRIRTSTSYGSKGGAIYFEGSGKLSISDVSFKECRSQGQLIGQGGAIYFAGSGNLSLSDVSFKECISNGQLTGQGGAIYIEGAGYHKMSDISFADCSVSGNEISEGGIIYSKGGQNKFSDVSFKRSSAIITESSQSNIDADQSSALGGGIMAIDWLNGSALSDVSFTSCVAGCGGGIYLDSASDRIKFSDVRFYDNIASVSGGGGIFARDTNIVYLRYCKFSGNQGYGSENGNDIHFSELGLNTEHPDMLQIKKDMIYKSKSSSAETRVYIVGIGSLYDWLPDRYQGEWPVWAQITMNVVAVVVVFIVIVLCICCCCKCCGMCCSSCCGACCFKGCLLCCNNCCLHCCCCKCSSNNGTKGNDRAILNRYNKGHCCESCCQGCCKQSGDQCCQKQRTIDNSNQNQQYRTAEEGQYYDKNNQQMQQRNGNGIVVVVSDNAYVPQYGAKQPYPTLQANPAYQYSSQQNQPSIPPPLQHNNDNPQVQYNPYSPQQQVNPIFSQPPPQNLQMPFGKEDFLQ